MSKEIPKSLSDRQEIQRQQTINLVLRAISDLRALKEPLKIKSIMEHTGLSRSVFAKPHIRKVLTEHGIITGSVPVADTPLMPTKSSDTSKEKHLREKLRKKDDTIAAITAENTELRRECELLRGRLFLLMQREK